MSDVVTEAAKMAVAAGLVYVSDSDPGIRRLRKRKTFADINPDDRPLVSASELTRIARLAIPPAYEQVWICTNPRGHLQATGRDARRRKQYRYHPEWRRLRDGAKFERMIEFGEALPRLRERLRRDLALPGLPKEKVLAVIVSLLDATRVRIGNNEYARDNNSYGLTTLRNRHVQFIRDGRLRFRFRGKGGADHEVPIDDKRLARLVTHCHELPGCIVAAGKKSRRGAAQYTCHLPQVLYQSGRFRRVAKREFAEGDSRRHLHGATQGRAARAQLPAPAVEGGQARFSETRARSRRGPDGEGFRCATQSERVSILILHARTLAPGAHAPPA